jgi:iron(III)-salmochelin esterase
VAARGYRRARSRATFRAVKRRAFLGTVGALLGALGAPARAKTPESKNLVQHDLVLGGDKRIARRALVLAPNHGASDTKWPVLVLLHGLGETGNEKLGIHAWGERYGLVTSYERLHRPPVARTLPKAKYLGDERLERINGTLSKTPFRGMVLVCPVTPNPQKSGMSSTRALDLYADWIEKTLLPAVYERVACARGAEYTALDGCSLGGYVAPEVFSRKPELFGILGGVQAAFSVAAADRYARRAAEIVKAHGPRRFHVETSTQDPFKKANRAFYDALVARGLSADFELVPGPHNQPWLREVGTLEMLLWHDRNLAR